MQTGFDPEKIKTDLDKLSDETVALNKSIFDENGLYKKYSSYSDELDSVIGFQENGPNNPISTLQRGINTFRDGINAIVAAKKYNDRSMVEQMANVIARTGLAGLQDGDSAFRGWRDETLKRIGEFRKSLR
ncbi:MAG: hypothetical protein ACREHV_17650 [Rhizomicrobium sp.]